MVRITTRLIMEEARRRGWKVRVVSEAPNLVEYTSPTGKRYLLNSNLTPQASAIQLLIAKEKWLLSELSLGLDIPTPETCLYTGDASAKAMLRKHGTLVVKPTNSSHGNGVTMGVTSLEAMQKAVARAREYSDQVLLQKQAIGPDYRLLFIDGVCVAAAIREPARVTGDGRHTIRELIAKENQGSERGVDYEKRLNVIDLAAAEIFLGKGLEQVPAKGAVCQVVGTANIGTGGTATDVTDTVPEHMLLHAKRVVKAVPLPVCGMDFIDDETVGPLLIELNSRPSFGLHTFPAVGQGRNVAGDLLQYLERSDQ